MSDLRQNLEHVPKPAFTGEAAVFGQRDEGSEAETYRRYVDVETRVAPENGNRSRNEVLGHALGTVSLLASRLREAREGTGMTHDAVAREARISSRYIRALENGDWRAFSAKVYAQGALKRVIGVCRMDDAEFLVRALDQEWDAAFHGSKSASQSPANIMQARALALTPRRIGVGAAVSVFALVAGFWGVRLAAFVAPPALYLAEPQDLAGYENAVVAVRGRTEKESRLTVNGRELTLDERGGFDEKIELPAGAHELRFVSQNRFGKEQTVVRHIFVNN